jgi:hypothetical protein
MNEEEKLRRLLSVSKPDTFWRGQKRRVMERVQGRKAPRVVWRLAPVMAAAALLVVLQLRKRPSPPPEPVPPASDWGLLQNLDLLEDLDHTLSTKSGKL